MNIIKNINSILLQILLFFVSVKSQLPFNFLAETGSSYNPNAVILYEPLTNYLLTVGNYSQLYVLDDVLALISNGKNSEEQVVINNSNCSGGPTLYSSWKIELLACAETQATLAIGDNTLNCANDQCYLNKHWVNYNNTQCTYPNMEDLSGIFNGTIPSPSCCNLIYASGILNDYNQNYACCNENSSDQCKSYISGISSIPNMNLYIGLWSINVGGTY